jgi:UDP-N-acetylglucosamine--N-acetylmuramyl-(pentapeptide) pyrophosphoryl-undecaprenol N-acetylglucosamine transferase
MDEFFPKSKLVETGNPVRNEIVQQAGKREAGFEHFGLDPNVFTLLVVGGSLGALSINESIAAGLGTLSKLNIQLIWQTGKGFYPQAKEAIDKKGSSRLMAFDFIKEMDLAYACADMVVSRAGAIAVSELCIVHKATILVPYPFASEDHQTKNAQALVDVNAAIMIKDNQARTQLISAISDLVGDPSRRELLKKNIAGLGKSDATNAIVNELYTLIDN